MPAYDMAGLIKAVPLTLTGTAPNDRAISSAGGIAFDEIDEHFMLRKKPGVFVAGEMLDWEAPTGGYLLQACFATGAAAGRGAVGWLKRAARELTSRPFDIRAQHLKLEPFLFGLRAIRLAPPPVPTRFIERLAVARRTSPDRPVCVAGS